MTETLVTPRVLREYALVADGERGALIAPDGSVAWLCVPGWDSPAAFSALLGGPGRYTVAPADPWHVWGGYYENGTLIWHNRWVGSSATECREALALPADPRRAVLLRRIEAVDGPAKVRVLLDVRGGYGRSRATSVERHGGIWTGRSGTTRFRWSGAAKARPVDGGLRMTIELAEGATHELVLEISDRDLPDEPADAGRTWAATEEAWSRVAPDCSDLIAVADARHAYAVLHGLTSASGAMVAAATTSLPERLEGSRNYDYRYAWIRDQCYAGLAVAARGPHPLLTGAVRFVTERLLADGPGLMPGYTVSGQPIPQERQLRGLRGFPGGPRGRGTGCAGSSSWTRSASRCRCWPPRRGTTCSTRRTGRRHPSPPRRSGNGGGNQTRASGSWTTGAGRTPGWPACPGCAPSRPWPPQGRRAGTGGGRPRGGPRWPTRSWPASATACTRPGAGSGRRTTSGWTPRCSSP